MMTEEFSNAIFARNKREGREEERDQNVAKETHNT